MTAFPVISSVSMYEEVSCKEGRQQMKIALACQRCQNRNYWTTKPSAGSQERLQMNKYCKTCAAHTMHAETK